MGGSEEEVASGLLSETADASDPLQMLPHLGREAALPCSDDVEDHDTATTTFRDCGETTVARLLTADSVLLRLALAAHLHLGRTLHLDDRYHDGDRWEACGADDQAALHEYLRAVLEAIGSRRTDLPRPALRYLEEYSRTVTALERRRRTEWSRRFIQTAPPDLEPAGFLTLAMLDATPAELTSRLGITFEFVDEEDGMGPRRVTSVLVDGRLFFLEHLDYSPEPGVEVYGTRPVQPFLDALGVMATWEPPEDLS